MRHPRIVSLAFISCVGIGMPAAADQHDPSLEPLMTELKTAPTAEAARPIEQRIWSIWGKSGDAAVDILMEQGVARLNEGDDDAALVLFDRVVGLAPGFAEGWNKRATTLYTMGRFDNSMQDIDKVLTLEPRHFGALSGLGLCNIRLGNDKAALAAFQRAAALDPNLPGVQANIEALKKRLIRDFYLTRCHLPAMRYDAPAAASSDDELRQRFWEIPNAVRRQLHHVVSQNPKTQDQAHAYRNCLSIRPRRHSGGQRLPTRPRLEGGARQRGHRTLRLAYPPPHRHERRPLYEPTSARDRPRYQRGAGGRLARLHAEAYRRLTPQVRPLPGAQDLLAALTAGGHRWAIATSGRMETAAWNLQALDVDPDTVPVVTRDQVKYAKPDPDLFLAAAARLDAPIEAAVIIGDAIWDMLAARRCRGFGVGLLSGGYGQEELERAGAARVYEDPADLLRHLDEVGGRR